MRKHQSSRCLWAVIFLFQFCSFSVSAQKSLSYDGIDDYASLPTGVVSSLSGDYTIEAWVYWRGAAASNWQRIFDFGSDMNVNMFLTTNGGNGAPRFAITTASGGNEQRISATTPLSLNTWHHIAVVVEHATNTGTLYINGASAAVNNSMTLRPSILGATTNNYLGRSQYPDPYFNGYIDEVRVSNSVRYTSSFTPQRSNFITDANTVALYHFDEGSGQDATDATGSFSGWLGANTTVEATDPSRDVLSVLPVTLRNFSALPAGKDVNLTWQTANEQFNKGFYVERSLNGVRFTSIGFVDARTGGSYAFTDANPTAGTIYYRLKQADQNGGFTYSRTLSVALVEKTGKIIWNATSSGSVEIRLIGGNNEQFQMTDMNGRVLQQGSLVNGKTIVSAVPAGVYTITVQLQNQKLVSARIQL